MWPRHFLLSPDDSPAPGAAPAADPAPAAPAAADPAPAPAPATPSLLSQATARAAPAAGEIKAGTAAPAAAKVTRDASVPAWVPEKFKDGEELAKAYGELETRMKTSGLPPKSADEYKWTPPAGVELDPAGTKQFKEFALQNGLSQKQYEGVMGAYMAHTKEIANDALSFVEEASVANLRKTLPAWQSDDGFHDQMRSVLRVAKEFDDADKLADWNDPRKLFECFYRVMARVGRELPEDGGMHSASNVQSAESLGALMKNPAYFDGKHPEHETIKAKVKAHHEAAAAIAQRKRFGH